jgi:outer membrane protein assembly factor BamA
MMRHITLAGFLFSAICALSAWGQNQGKPEECDSNPLRADEGPRTRMQVTWVKNADGKRTAVWSPVKEMRVARLIFIGRAALPLAVQNQIAKSISEHDYDDNQEGLEELLERTRDAWQAQGYFKTKVEHSGSQALEESPEKRTVAVTILVDAGTQYRLDEVNFKQISWSNTAQAGPPAPSLPQPEGQFASEQLRAIFQIEQGDIFDTHKLQKGVEELRKAYGANGFINMSVVPSFNVDETSDRITLDIEIEEGKQFHIGKVDVQGLAPGISTQLFEGSGLVPGNIFNTSRLDEFVKRNQSILFYGDRTEDDVERRLDVDSSTVDLSFRFRDCLAR